MTIVATPDRPGLGADLQDAGEVGPAPKNARTEAISPW
jgi:hypothetical protein